MDKQHQEKLILCLEMIERISNNQIIILKEEIGNKILIYKTLRMIRII